MNQILKEKSNTEIFTDVFTETKEEEAENCTTSVPFEYKEME